MRLGGADHREPPAVRASDAPELGEELVDLGLVADRIAADERRARDDAVREEGSPRRREEVALVAPQREEGEAVAAVRVDERARDPPLPHRLRDRVPERPQPEVERERAEHDAEAEKRVAEPRAASRRRAAPIAERPRRLPRARRRDRAAAGRCAGSPGTSKRRRQRTSATSSSSEIVASSKSRPLARCATADATTTTTASCQARRRRCASERDSQIRPIPNATARTRAASGQPGGSTPRTKSNPVRHLRRQRRDDADHADERGSPGEEPLGAWADAASRGQGTTCS